MTVSKILKLQGFVWKTMQAWLDGKSCFSRTNASNFWRPLQSLLLRFSGYLFLIHSFSLCWQNFSKVNCFRFYWKLIMWSSHAKSLFIYYSYVSLNYFLVDISLVLFFFPHYFSSVHPGASRAELMMMTVSEIVNQLITAHEKGNDVNLNK